MKTQQFLTISLWLLFTGLSQIQAQAYKLIETVGPASTSIYQMVDANQQVVRLPSSIVKALDGPSMVSLKNDALIYMDGLSVNAYNLKRKEKAKLLPYMKAWTAFLNQPGQMI